MGKDTGPLITSESEAAAAAFTARVDMLAASKAAIAAQTGSISFSGGDQLAAVTVGVQQRGSDERGV
jgi:hypothetical protein